MLELPYLPPAEYDVRLTARRLSGTDTLAVGLVFGGRQVFCVFEAYGGEWSGLDQVDGIRVGTNVTRVSRRIFQSGASTKIEIRVRHDSISAFADDTLVFHWVGGSSRVSVWRDNLLRHSDSLFLLTVSSRFQISELTIIPLSGPGRRVFGDPSTVSPEQTAADVTCWCGGEVAVHGKTRPSSQSDQPICRKASLTLLTSVCPDARPIPRACWRRCQPCRVSVPCVSSTQR